MIDILFLYPPYVKREGGGNLFPLGIGYLISGVIKSGLSFDYVDCQTLYSTDSQTFINRVAERLCRNQYMLIAISCITTAAVPYLYDIVSACRLTHKTTPIVMGGQLVSIDYVETLFFKEYDIDAVCRGDGDYAIPELVKHLRNGGKIDTFPLISLPGRMAPKNTIDDINRIPFPFRNEDIVKTTCLSFGRSTYDEKSLPIITSRGCAYKCYYCVSGCNTGKNFQKRTWKNIVSEIKYLQDRYKIFSIVFYDDCFFYNKKTVNEDVDEFARQIKEQNCKPFSWQMELRADIMSAVSPDSWKKLFEFGCRQINVGIESCYDDSLRFLGKKISTDVIVNAFDSLKRFAPKIISTATYIVGGPNSEPEHIMALADFSKKIGLLYIKIYPLELHPGTVLYEHYYNHSDAWFRYITSPDNPYTCMYYEQNRNRLNILFENIQKAYQRFYLDGYWEKKAKDFYGERFAEIKLNLLKTYHLEEQND